MAEKKQEDQFYLPPPKLGKWDSFKLFMWNPDRKEFMGRTGLSWAKVGAFYVIFYAFLAAFFALMLVIFYQTLDNHAPKWQKESSIIGVNPGLGFRPRPPEDHIESTLIWFKAPDGSKSNNDRASAHPSAKYYLEQLDELHNEYVERKGTSDQKDCGKEKMNNRDALCIFNLLESQSEAARKEGSGDTNSNKDDPCTKQNSWGILEGKPCIAIKLNKIFDWDPIPYTSREEMPTGDSHKGLDAFFNKHAFISELVYVICEGENPADKENLGNAKYQGDLPGVRMRYFPFRNQPGYLSPLVFVQFPDMKKGVLINVECRAYAKNIDIKPVERQGTVHFELLVDS